MSSSDKYALRKAGLFVLIWARVRRMSLESVTSVLFIGGGWWGGGGGGVIFDCLHVLRPLWYVCIVERSVFMPFSVMLSGFVLMFAVYLVGCFKPWSVPV